MTETGTVRPAEARVTIRRDHETDVQQRQIYARIDDEANRTLLFGDAFTIGVAPGRHRLRANNTLVWKTVHFDIRAGDHVEFVLINRTSKLAFGFLALLGVAPLMLAIEQRTLSDA